jgi:hypothetical protein
MRPVLNHSSDCRGSRAGCNDFVSQAARLPLQVHVKQRAIRLCEISVPHSKLIGSTCPTISEWAGLRLRGRSRKATRGRPRTAGRQRALRKLSRNRISVFNRSADQRSRDGSEERHFPNDLSRSKSSRRRGGCGSFAIEFAFRKKPWFSSLPGSFSRSSGVSGLADSSCQLHCVGRWTFVGAWSLGVGLSLFSLANRSIL